MKRNLHQEMKKHFADQHACYILITCNNPSKDGNIQVEMSYQGDDLLASLMLSNAQSVIDEKVEEALNC